MMQKISIVILLFLSSFAAVKAQQVLYTQTFEDTASLFQDYVLVNLDNGNPAGTEWDTLQSVPWFVSTAGAAGNHAAIATSDYDPAIAADDWFITPAIRTGKASKLSWKNLSLTAGKTDTYQVFVSTTEQSVAGCLFNGPVAGFSSSNTTFASNTIDLAAAGYANQNIFIGFRLTTPSGGGKLAIDDLVVTEDSTQFVTLKFMVNMSRYIQDSLFDPKTDTVDVAGTFNNFVGTKNILSIVPGSDSAIYAISIPGFVDGDRLEFKFRINSTWNDSIVEFPYGQPNRVWTVEHDKYTYTCYYNDQGTSYSIPENNIMSLVNVYPNPAQSNVSIDCPEKISRIRLISLSGSLLYDLKTDSGKTVNMDVSPLAKGTYLLLFYSSEKFAGSRKIIRN